MQVTCCSHCGHLNKFRGEPAYTDGMVRQTCRRATCRKSYRDVPFERTDKNDHFNDYKATEG